MKNDLTTGAWQHDIGCPISITLLSTSDLYRIGEMVKDQHGNGELLHNGENGLIAIYFFAIEQWCGNGELLNNS